MTLGNLDLYVLHQQLDSPCLMPPFYRYAYTGIQNVTYLVIPSMDFWNIPMTMARHNASLIR